MSGWSRNALPATVPGRATKRLHRRSQRHHRGRVPFRYRYFLLALTFAMVLAVVTWTSVELPLSAPAPTPGVTVNSVSAAPPVTTAPPVTALQAAMELVPNNGSARPLAYQEAIERQIRRFGACFGSFEEVKDFDSIVLPNCRSSELRPQSPPILFEDTSLKVVRAELPAAQIVPDRTGQRALLDEIHIARNAFPQQSKIAFHHEFLGWSGTERTPLTLVAYRLTSSEPYRGTNQSGIWLCEWNAESSPPRLATISLVDFEEITISNRSGKIFEDVTDSIFQNEPIVSGQLRTAEDVWMGWLPRGFGGELSTPHGIAVGDVNGDGRDDIYVCQPAGLPNRLLIQKNDGTLDDLSVQAGVDLLDETVSALLLDLDNDRDQDLVCVTPEVVLGYSNEGDGRFKLRMTKGGLQAGRSVSAADVDLDGDLDLFVCGSGARRSAARASSAGFPIPFANPMNGGRSLMLINSGQWTFHDVTDEIGLGQELQRWNVAASWHDYDSDGDPDLTIVSEFGPPRLYRNDADHFEMLPWPGSYPLNGQSCHWTDLENNGRFDLVVLGFDDDRNAGNCIWRPIPNGWQSFQPLALQSPHWRFGGAGIDMNNDGREDLVFAAGNITNTGYDLKHWYAANIASAPSDILDQEHRDKAEQRWRSLHRDLRHGATLAGKDRQQALLNVVGGQLIDISGISGLDFRQDGRAFAVVDWDLDGDLDLWSRNRSGPQVRLLVNRLESRHQYLAIKLEGKAANRDAVGARAELHLTHASSIGDPRRQVVTREVSAGSGYVSQSSKWLHFGIGEGLYIEKLVIHWPGKVTQELTGLHENRRYHLLQGEAQATELTLAPARLQPQDAPVSLPMSRRVPLATPIPLEPLRLTDSSAHLLPLPHEDAIWFIVDPRAAGSQQWVEESRRLFREKNLPLLVAATEDPAPAIRPMVDIVLGNDSVQKLLLLQEELVESASEQKLPLALFLGSGGKLLASYPGEPNPSPWIEDVLQFRADPASFVDKALPYPGRWHQPLFDPGLGGIAESLQAAGYAEEATAYARENQAWQESSSGRVARSYEDYLVEQLSPLSLEAAQLLLRQESSEEIVARFTDVAVVAGDPSAAYNNIGVIWMAVEDWQRARRNFERAIEAKADCAPALANLAAVELHLREPARAVRHLRLAINADPEVSYSKAAFAWILATHSEESIRDAKWALQLAKEVVAASPGDARALDLLAAAYAANAIYPEAERTLRDALEQLQRADDPHLTEAIQSRLRLYQSHKPYLDSESSIGGASEN